MEKCQTTYNKDSFRPDCILLYPIPYSGIIRLTFRKCPFHGLIQSILGCDLVHFSPWYGLNRMLKWCLLQCKKVSVGHKSLLINNLQHPLIIRVFAAEGKSVRKYSFIFRGRTGNSDRKIKIRLQSESWPYRLRFWYKKNTHSGLKQQSFC